MNKECFFDKVNKECWVGGGVPSEQRGGGGGGGGGASFRNIKNQQIQYQADLRLVFLVAFFFSQNNEGEEEEDNLFFV